MPAEAALAIVVRGTDWSETSRITTLFTREFGKVRALAKGGRRLKSSFEIAFDLLTVCRVMVIRKGHGGLDLLTEARMAEQFPHLRDDLAALYSGYYIAELLSEGTADYDPHPHLFDTAIETLRQLRGDPNEWPARIAAFELAWLRELGYSPRLEDCAACGIVPDDSARLAFSPMAGGILCGNCALSASDRRPLSAYGLIALRRLAAGNNQSLLSTEQSELRPLLGQTVSFVLGRRPKLAAYVDGSSIQTGSAPQ